MAGIPVTTETAQWSSRFAFIMAAVGSSVGLGNLWRFSAEAGENGGGAFILVYLCCVFFVGIPVLMSEYVVGRAGRASSAVLSGADLAARSNVSKGWNSFSWVGMIAAFGIVSFYCVVAAWVMMYIPKFLFGAFDGQTAAQIGDQFYNDALGRELIIPDDGDPYLGGHVSKGHYLTLAYFTAFAFFTAWVVSRGVSKGIETTAKLLMPIFFLLLIILSLFSLYTGFNTVVPGDIVDGVQGSDTNAGRKALGFMFSPDWSKLSPEVATKALGQAFFSIGIGSAIMITYGSYLPKSISIPRSAILVALTDTFVAIVAGLAIFPIVFANSLAPNSGGGLFFETLPVAMQSLPGGNIIGAAFFFLAFFAAITSSISLFEPSVSYVAEQFKMTRKRAATIMGLIMWAIGAVCVFSYETLDGIDKFTGTLLLPLSGLILVLFVGWRLKKAVLEEELHGVSKRFANFLMLLVRFVAPIFVGSVLFFGFLEKYVPNVYAIIFG